MFKEQRGTSHARKTFCPNIMLANHDSVLPEEKKLENEWLFDHLKDADW